VHESSESSVGLWQQWRRQDFVTGGREVWVYRWSRVRSPPVLVVLSVYQRGSLLDGRAMYLSCDTKKFHDNESTHILHNFWTSTHRGKAFPPYPPGGATVWQPKASRMKSARKNTKEETPAFTHQQTASVTGDSEPVRHQIALVRHFQPRVHHISMSHELLCVICILSVGGVA